jgi:hypothetical protein
MSEFIIWFTSLEPVWALLIFPLLLGSAMLYVLISCWRDHLKQKKLEANPIGMDEDEYVRFNYKRFHK